jgi:hypothetical protein
MAHAKVVSAVTVTLELTEKEALWLHGISKNSMQSSESVASQEARENIFSALANAHVRSIMEN